MLIVVRKIKYLCTKVVFARDSEPTGLKHFIDYLFFMYTKIINMLASGLAQTNEI